MTLVQRESPKLAAPASPLHSEVQLKVLISLLKKEPEGEGVLRLCRIGFGTVGAMGQ